MNPERLGSNSMAYFSTTVFANLQLDSPGNNCWSHATALITESRLCIESRGQFLGRVGSGKWVSRSTFFFRLVRVLSTSTSSAFFVHPIFMNLSGLESSAKCLWTQKKLCYWPISEVQWSQCMAEPIVHRCLQAPLSTVSHSLKWT